MKIMYCWRCRDDVPMLNEEEYQVIYELYGQCLMEAKKLGGPLTQHFQPVVTKYREMTGFKGATIANAVMHHNIALYGEPCLRCGKPLRSPQACFCAACGQPVEAQNH